MRGRQVDVGERRPRGERVRCQRPHHVVGPESEPTEGVTGGRSSGTVRFVTTTVDEVTEDRDRGERTNPSVSRCLRSDKRPPPGFKNVSK